MSTKARFAGVVARTATESAGYTPAARIGARFAGRRLAWWLSLTMSGLCLMPVLQVTSALWTPAPEVWAHVGPLLPQLLLNTAVIALGVALGAGTIGTGLAWLTALHEFPGRRMFSWALILPLAMPAYVLGFVLVGLFDYSGPVQSFWREYCGSSAWFPAIRTRGGAILALTLALYPYVYLLARNAFLTQSVRILEAARSLGMNGRQTFFRVSLPMARPWIGAGISLVLMETLADFGVVSVFNVETFTTAIYKAWFGLFSLPAAAQLASLLVLFALLILFAERRQRARQRYYFGARGSSIVGRRELQGWRAFLAMGSCGVVLLFAFFLPMLQLLIWSADVVAQEADARFFTYLFDTLSISAGTAVLIVLSALCLSLVKRHYGDWFTRTLLMLATLGYAMPGTVLAVGVVIPLAAFDQLLIDTGQRLRGVELSPLFGGSLVTLVLAYSIRFLAVGFGSVDSAMERITPALEEAARSLGIGGVALLRRLHLPLLRHGLLGALLLVAVDIMKEMPMTLLMRPFGWDTLAVRIFEMTSEGEWQRAALPAVVLVMGGLLPIAWLIHVAERTR